MKSALYDAYDDLKDKLDRFKPDFKIHQDDMIINDKEYETTNILGSGMFGIAYKAKRQKKDYVIKVSNLKGEIKSTAGVLIPYEDVALNEIKILSYITKKLGCKANMNLVCLVDYEIKDNKLYEVLYYHYGFTFDNLVKIMVSAYIKMDLLVFIDFFHNMLKILAELEKLKIVHNDIHGGNLLFSFKEDRIVILDFGIACKVKMKKCYNAFIGAYVNYYRDISMAASILKPFIDNDLIKYEKTKENKIAILELETLIDIMIEDAESTKMDLDQIFISFYEIISKLGLEY